VHNGRKISAATSRASRFRKISLAQKSIILYIYEQINDDDDDDDDDDSATVNTLYLFLINL